MSLNACAEIVEKGDRDRFRAVMASPVEARRVLFPLFAFNVEVTRAPWVTQEPMIAEMRLQWWRDAVEEIGQCGVVRKHEVVDALAEVLDAVGAASLDALIVARRWDIYSDAFEDADHLDSYLDATSGNLLWTAARLLGAKDERAVRDYSYGIGVANLLRAIPELEARGRKPLVDGTSQGVLEMAKRGIAKLDASVPKDVRLAGFLARPTLKKAIKNPSAVVNDQLDIGPMAQGWALLRAAL